MSHRMSLTAALGLLAALGTGATASQEFVSKELGFAVLLPAEPKHELQRVEGPQGPVAIHRFMAEAKHAIFSITVSELPAASVGPEALLDAARNESLKGGKLLFERPVSTQGIAGRFVGIARENLLATMAFYVAPKRRLLYQLAAVALPGAPDSKALTDEIDRYFASIRFFGVTSAQAVQPSQGAAQVFVPFRHIGGVVPGETRRSAVFTAFGKPERTEITEVRKVAGVELGGNTLLEYPSLGLSVLITKENAAKADPVIESVMAVSPYAGRSPNGLSIGMPWKKALEILKRDYHLESDLGGSMNFAEKPGGKPDLQVWFEDDKLTRVKLFPR